MIYSPLLSFNCSADGFLSSSSLLFVFAVIILTDYFVFLLLFSSFKHFIRNSLTSRLCITTTCSAVEFRFFGPHSEVEIGLSGSLEIPYVNLLIFE